MSILSTDKKGYLYMKTSSGYLKLLPRTLASLVSLDNGNSVETEISNIKSAASNLSSTVSGHTTTLNSHGSSISAIKTKTDALKDAANKTVANNLTTTKDGYVLDARMGKSLQDSITTLNSTLIRQIDYGVHDTNEKSLGEKVHSLSVWVTLPSNNTGTYDLKLPNDTKYAWIDSANSYVARNDYSEAFPLPYVNPRDGSWSNCIGVKLNNKKLIIFTSNDWSGYGAFVTVKFISNSYI